MDSASTIEITGIAGGVVSGRLRVADENRPKPALSLMVSGQQVGRVDVSKAAQPGVYDLRAQLPVEVVEQGLTLVTLCDPAQPVVAAHVSLIAGAPVDVDLASEVAALRAELEMLKDVLRRMARVRD